MAKKVYIVIDQYHIKGPKPSNPPWKKTHHMPSLINAHKSDIPSSFSSRLNIPNNFLIRTDKSFLGSVLIFGEVRSLKFPDPLFVSDDCKRKREKKRAGITYRISSV